MMSWFPVADGRQAGKVWSVRIEVMDGRLVVPNVHSKTSDVCPSSRQVCPGGRIASPSGCQPCPSSHIAHLVSRPAAPVSPRPARWVYNDKGTALLWCGEWCPVFALSLRRDYSARLIASLGQTLAHVPHSVQASGSIEYFSPSEIAPEGHSSIHVPHAMQSLPIT